MQNGDCVGVQIKASKTLSWKKHVQDKFDLSCYLNMKVELEGILELQLRTFKSETALQEVFPPSTSLAQGGELVETLTGRGCWLQTLTDH